MAYLLKVEKLHPAPLPPLPVQKVDASMKLMPPKPSLKISRVQQGGRYVAVTDKCFTGRAKEWLSYAT